MSATPEASGTTTVVTDSIHFDTKGDADMVNITEQVIDCVAATGLRSGIVTVFVPGATGAVTTLEFEPGVVQDFRDVFNHIALASNQRHPPGRQRPRPRARRPAGAVAGRPLR